MLALHEVAQNRAALTRWARAASPWLGALVPGVVGMVVFVAGAVLLVSAAVPGVHGRIAALAARLPLGVIETSHVASSVVGAILLVLARGLQRRLDGAYRVALIVLSVGIVASLLKGLDWEEAGVLAFTLGVMIAGRREFYRRASLLHEAFTLRWFAAVVAVFSGAAWVGLLAYRHVSYDSALWWSFAPGGEAPRSLRASVAAGVVLIVFGTFRLLRPARPTPALPPEADLERAARIAARSPGTLAPLVLLGDKSLLFSADGEAFVMYGVNGRVWAALGDPVGSEASKRELAWEFRNEVDRHDGWTVFYQVPPESLPLYIEIGLQFAPLGEEARVPLTSFSLEGHERKELRHAVRRAESEGLSFEVVPPGDVAALLPELRRISDGWLARKNVREKRFSLGYFDDRYLARCPVAIVRRAGRTVAFANLLTAGDRGEASIDLMRFDEDTSPGLMDYLLTRAMLWAREAGFEAFNLGMAPLSGIEDRPRAPAWNRLAGLAYRHGEHFYNFQDLRRFKEKFHPLWQPRYLASSGGLALTPVLVGVASLVAGGVAGIVRK
jgi:phosphatidylglycerol lysyltransferase